MSSGIKIQVSDDLSLDDITKSLEAVIEELRKGEHEPNLSVLLSKENPAMAHLVKFMDESFDIMTNSLVKEISKVLKPE
jgi:hypothetical protein